MYMYIMYRNRSRENKKETGFNKKNKENKKETSAVLQIWKEEEEGGGVPCRRYTRTRRRWCWGRGMRWNAWSASSTRALVWNLLRSSRPQSRGTSPTSSPSASRWIASAAPSPPSPTAISGNGELSFSNESVLWLHGFGVSSSFLFGVDSDPLLLSIIFSSKHVNFMNFSRDQFLIKRKLRHFNTMGKAYFKSFFNRWPNTL